MIPSFRVSYSDFQKIILTVAKAVKVEQNSKASNTAYLIKLILNETLINEHQSLYKKDLYSSSAQLCKNHTIEEITDRPLLVVLNFPRKQVGKTMSDCLTTGVQKDTSDLNEKKDSTVFMTPSHVVEWGSRVGLLAEEELINTNPRDLNWPTFVMCDLRIGTLEEFQSLIPVTENVNQVLFRIHLGEILGSRNCIARLHTALDARALIGKQVMVLTNLDETSKTDLFSVADSYTPSGDEVILCTIGGCSVLEPAKCVENGFKLA